MHARDTCFTFGPSTSPSAQSCCSVFPMLDVRSRGFTFGPGQRHTLNPIYLPVGTKLLFTLSMGAFEMLRLEERRPPPQDRSCGMEWSREDFAHQPFNAYDISSYSVHAEEHTFLVSTKTIDDDATEATFAFDTVKLAWKLLGNWALPFDGRGHFDRRLEAFVGLSKDPGTFGQLCSCQAPNSAYTAGHEGQCAPPPRLLCKEKLFSQDPSHRHVSATLVYMGRESKFCLVECLSIDEDNRQHVNEDDDCPDQALVKEEGDVGLHGCCVYLYRLTTFSLSLDTNGDLTTSGSCRVEFYRVPDATTKSFLAHDPVAFWM
ncbi:hypothetical protein CFC21_105694 [Triticum aestivum]|uniref:Uncharacterized protein n=3 Tax=Triticum TaxID=4564 RepID=A0A9R1C5Z2_TRITD|nr:hypothetical protein CFC21_105694 [Triticum aestivum]VAI93526.1 unnamed protein product [Triticum turgidum subsp. durum]